MQPNHFVRKNIKFVTPAKAAELQRHTFQAGDLIVTKLGDPLGEACIIPESLEFGVIVADLVRVRLNASRALLEAVCYAINSPPVHRQFEEQTKGTTRPRVNLSHIRGLRLPLPEDLSDQQELVGEIEKQFTRLDAGVASLKRVQTALKRYRASVLKAACEGHLVATEAELARREGRPYEPATELLQRLRVQGESRRASIRRNKSRDDQRTPMNENWQRDVSVSGGLSDLKSERIPEGWAWATIEQLRSPESNSITDGPFGSNLKTEHYTPSGPRVIRLQNVGEGVFTDAVAHISQEHFMRLAKHRVFAGDLVIAALGENLPRSCIVPKSVGDAIVKADCIRFKPDAAISISYLNSALNAEPIKNRTKTIVHGVGRPRLNLSEIKSILLPIPPLREQQRIAGEVERRFSIIEELEAVVEANLKRSERLRQSILHHAFTGKL